MSAFQHILFPVDFSLLDRFAVISAELDPSESDGDIAMFQQCKKLRDEFSHGEAIDENSLPVADIQGLVRKLLRLHANRL